MSQGDASFKCYRFVLLGGAVPTSIVFWLRLPTSTKTQISRFGHTRSITAKWGVMKGIAWVRTWNLEREDCFCSERLRRPFPEQKHLGRECEGRIRHYNSDAPRHVRSAVSSPVTEAPPSLHNIAPSAPLRPDTTYTAGMYTPRFGVTPLPCLAFLTGVTRGTESCEIGLCLS
jgi:hypothetical protein